MSDCVAANIASYRDSLKGPFPYSEHNGCLPHTGAHVGEAMETPHVDDFMGHYNAIVGTSNYAVVHFSEITGYTAKKKSATRWFSTNDVQELSLLPNAANGNLLKWADKMIDEGICEKTAPKLRAFLLNPTKLKLFMLELTTVVMVGKGLKARNTALEGDTFEFVTGYDTMLHMGEGNQEPRHAGAGRGDQEARHRQRRHRRRRRRRRHRRHRRHRRRRHRHRRHRRRRLRRPRHPGIAHPRHLQDGERLRRLRLLGLAWRDAAAAALLREADELGERREEADPHQVREGS